MEIDPSKIYSDDDLERAMATVARVIELYGDTYWPILERLEMELDARRIKSARLSKHLKRYQNRKERPPKALRRPVSLAATPKRLR